MDALTIAQNNPSKEAVFFAIGFETTAPANAMTVYQAKQLALSNFSILNAQVLIPPAIETILSSPAGKVQGFLAAGHVCTIMGFAEYEKIALKYKVPITVTGFEPLDILQGIHMNIIQLEQGRAFVENQYARAVQRAGNIQAQKLMREVYKVVNRTWRGLGEIPDSGLTLADKYTEYDAENKFDISGLDSKESAECISGLILQGLKKPPECKAFGKRCTPENPLGATMVSSEGACAAYYRYRKVISNQNQ